MIRRLLLLAGLLLSGAAHAADSAIQWQGWSPKIFERAQAERKPIFLYLEAVWCHWCHVMQEQTFAQPEVQQRLARDFIAIKVDHDANPLLANRYRDYGWPALIFLAADGTELVKRAGFIAPGPFARLLQNISADPRPESAPDVVVAVAAGGPQLTDAQRDYLLQRHEASYDSRLGGLRTAQKFIDRDSVEYALTHARENPAERRKAEQTLTAALSLMDPVWGGMYQYSTGGDWLSPHYEKIMRTQAGALRIYALAYGLLGRPADLNAVNAIQSYLLRFLRAPSGAFHTSQDADLIPGQKSSGYFALNDAQRRKLGMPRIDPHHYTDANAQAAEALMTVFRYTGNAEALKSAQDAMDWVIDNRTRKKGGFHHSNQKDGPYLGDVLSMARSALQRYVVTADVIWLKRAVNYADESHAIFRNPIAGFFGAPAAFAGPLKPRPVLEENISAARFFNLLSHYSGAPRHRAAAEHAMRFLANDAQIFNLFEEAGVLLAHEEFARDPVHLTVVGARKSSAAQALFATALQKTPWYARIEWKETPSAVLMNDDVVYPKFDRPAGYVCSGRRCSAPRFTPEEYAAAIVGLSASNP